MENKLTKAAGGTGLWPVQFGVPPNCERGGSFLMEKFFRADFVLRHSVSDATPETTGVTPVPPVFSRLCVNN
jgi:hypothetical protein